MTNAPQEPVDLTDPAISPHRLQELAQTHPEQWDEILAHPNVYPGLAQWIRDRQAEQAAAAGPTEQADEDFGDGATKVYEPVETSEATTEVFDATDDEASEPEPGPVNDEAEVEPEATASETTEDDDEHAAHSWASPEPTGQQAAAAASTEQASTEETQDSSQPTPATGQGEPVWGWPGTGATAASQTQQQNEPQQQFHAPPTGFGQPPYGYQQQPPYGYGQPQGQQQAYGQQAYGQAFQPPQRQRTPINLNSARTWGLFVAGGAAFMTLFGFFFSPTMGGFGVPSTSHLASGGWMILLLFLATVTLSILQLLKPSAWMRYFFIAVSFGAAFTMIGRTTALIGFFTMQNTSFSVIWMLFMSLVLLAGIMVYTAPTASDSNDSSGNSAQPQQQPGQQFGQPMYQQPPYAPHPGNPPYGGQQPGGYPPQY